MGNLFLLRTQELFKSNGAWAVLKSSKNKIKNVVVGSLQENVRARRNSLVNISSGIGVAIFYGLMKMMY